MIKHKELTATNLRIALSVSLFLIIAIAITIFYFANTQLNEFATTVSRTVADSKASENNLQTLQRIERTLEQEKDTIDRVNSIVAESQSYRYQNQILFDLNQYAASAGVTITNLTFNDGSTPAAATPATPAPTTTPGAAAAIQGGVKSTSVLVTLANPISYNSLLRFIKSIEQNLTKMQISRISLSKGADTNAVTTDSLTIEVYVR
ncbi:MAG TPA: hypothetical protein VFM68_01135 [Candidatus Saccharimonadales bacterium]|nr:hypothetical protein [Candidatus Saccharimonadales bacterium]